MYKPEVHRTVDRVQLLEKLDFDLTITDAAYTSDHSTEGELRVFRKADEQAVEDREHPPTHVTEPVAEQVRDALDVGGQSSAFPGTRLFVGLARETPVKQEEGGFQDDYVTEAMHVDGVPENGVVEFDTDWELQEARRSVAEGVSKVDEKPYEIANLPADHLPLIVRAEIRRDARRIEQVLQMADHDDMRGHARFEGLAALLIEVEHRDTTATDRAMQVDGFRMEMSRTFPQADFYPQQGSTYDPESKRVEWGASRIKPGDAATFAVVGPIGELLDIDRIDADLRAKLPGQTLSGMTVAGVFDESGEPIDDETAPPVTGSPERIDETIRITADVELDPSALRGEAQEVSNATVSVGIPPTELFDRVVDICDRNGIHITDRQAPGEATPVTGRSGVFEISGEQMGELDVRREYGDEGVVYASMEIEGRFAGETEEQQVSAFDDSEDRLVRRTEGLDEQGQSTISLTARSASSELNSRFISTIEDSFGGGV